MTQNKVRLLKLLTSSYWLTGLVCIALLSPILCSQRPLVCKYQNRWYFPAFYAYTSDAALRSPQHGLYEIALHNTWNTTIFEHKIPAPIGINPTDRDTEYIKTAPFRHWKHLLGTDPNGRDLLAGLIAGTRVVCTIGLLALLAACIPGILLGVLAGYYGDTGLRISKWHLFITIPLLVCALIFNYTVWHAELVHQTTRWFFQCIGLGFAVFLFSAFGKFLLPTGAWLHHSVALPLDILIQRFSEVINSFPKLITLTVLTAIWSTSPSLELIALIAGLLTWPGIAAYVRAEMLRIRSLDYIAAARLSGIPEWRVILNHALPNALPPAFVAMSMYAASAILLETSLSFLGIRRDVETVSWGSLMLEARLYPTAWWLALFPGLMITLTIYALYKLSMRQSNLHTPGQ